MHAQSCLPLFNPVDCSPQGSAVREILQARKLEWAAISASKGSSPSRYWTLFCGSCLGRWVLYHFATWGALMSVWTSFHLNLCKFFCVCSPDLLLYWSLRADYDIFRNSDSQLTSCSYLEISHTVCSHHRSQWVLPLGLHTPSWLQNTDQHTTARVSHS